MENIALVYMVAGLSSRYKYKIKAFAKIWSKNESLIEYSLNQALKSKFSKIIFVVGKKTEKSFKEKFKKSYRGIPVFYALQDYDEKTRDRPWGTTDALCSASSFLDCPFVICNGDDIYGENSFRMLFEHLEKSKEEATIGYRLKGVVPEIGEVSRGIARAEKGYVKNIKDVFHISIANLSSNNLKPEDLCTMGIFALHPETLELLEEELKKFKEDNKEDREAECILPNLLSDLIKLGKIKMKIYPAVDKWYGITNPGDEKQVNKNLKLDNIKKM